MTLGRAIMAISTLLAVAACADRARVEVPPAGQDKAGQDIVTTIPADRSGATLPPRESQALGVPLDSVVASAETPKPPPAVEAIEQARDESAADSRDGAANPAESRESTPEPPERSDSPKPTEPADAGAAGTDGAKPRQSLAANPAGKPAKDQTIPAGNNLFVALEVEVRPTTGENGQAEPAAEPVQTQPGPAIAGGDPGVDDLNQVAALPPDTPESDAVAEIEEAGQPEIRPENQPLKCDIVRLLGYSIGQWRLRGESAGAARRKAADEVARQIENVSEGRLGFKAWMYANRIYDLKPDHSPEGFAAYVHAACLILREQKGLIPVDEESREMLDRALRGCESVARGDSGLDACISERMERIVQERGWRTD